MAYRSKVYMRLEGLEEIRKRISGLENHLKKRLLVRAMKVGLLKLQAIAEAKTPTGNRIRVVAHRGHPGYLKGSFRIMNMRSRNPSLIEMQLQNTAYTALWVEYGHKIVKGKGSKKRIVGSAAASPFMRPAFDESAEMIIETIRQAIFFEIEKKGL